MKKKIFSIFMCGAMAISLVTGLNTHTAFAEEIKTVSSETEPVNPTVTYRSHIQTYGDQEEVKNGGTSGVIGESKRLEAIWLSISGTGYEGGITYQAHVQKYGWMDWVKDGELCGTTGEAKRVEAIKISLYGEVAEQYDVYYRGYVQKYGWLDWAKNGAAAGSASQGLRLEAIQVKLVKKESDNTLWTACSFLDLGKTATGVTGLVNYMTHVQTYGDQGYVCDGSFTGTFGEGKRLEALRVKLGDTGYSGGIQYKTHVQTFGWENEWIKDGELSGTSGLGKRLEAIKISLYGEVSKYFDVYYRVHVQTYGWLGWTKNGEVAGTEGLSKRMESLQIMLVPKDSSSQLLNWKATNVSCINGKDLGKMSYSERIFYISEGKGIKNIDKQTAQSWQTTIVVPTWDFESKTSMNKVTKYRMLTLNKAIANYTYRVFAEIYNSPDKPVIDGELYAFSYRANVNNPSVLSQHSFGCAIDINASNNPNGVAGKTYEQWMAMPESTVAEKQKKAKTIYVGSTIVKIFDKYGFTWGGYSWRDGMHFDFIDY